MRSITLRGSTLPAAVLDDKVHKGLTEALQLTMTDADDRQHLVIGIATDPISTRVDPTGGNTR
mgnify:CR=1 FL=1